MLGSVRESDGISREGKPTLLGAGGERCVFSASHRADLPLLRARPGLALLGEDLRAVLVSRRSHAEPLAVLDLDFLTTEFARPGAVAEFRRHTAPTLTGAPASTVSVQASRASFAAGPEVGISARRVVHIDSVVREVILRGTDNDARNLEATLETASSQ